MTDQNREGTVCDLTEYLRDAMRDPEFAAAYVAEHRRRDLAYPGMNRPVAVKPSRRKVGWR